MRYPGNSFKEPTFTVPEIIEYGTLKSVITKITAQNPPR